MATELHAGQQVGAALASSIPRPEQMIWFRPAAPEIAIEWLPRLIPEAEAKLYGVLTELIPAPSMVMPNPTLPAAKSRWRRSPSSPAYRGGG